MLLLDDASVSDHHDARRKRDPEALRFFTQAEVYLEGLGSDGGHASLHHAQFLIRRARYEEALAEFDQLCIANDAGATDELQGRAQRIEAAGPALREAAPAAAVGA